MPTKTALIAFTLAALALAPTWAKTVTDEKSGICVDLPDADGWKMEEGKVPTATNDEGLTIVVVRFERDLPGVVIKRIADEFNVYMKDAKTDDSDKIDCHGMQADKVSGYGMKDDKPVKFTAILVCKDNTSTVGIIAFGSETPFKRHMRDIDAAFDSVKPK